MKLTNKIYNCSITCSGEFIGSNPIRLYKFD